MGKYEEMMADFKLFNGLSDATADNLVCHMNEIVQIGATYNSDFETITTNVKNLTDNAKAMCNNKISERKEFVRRKVSELKDLIFICEGSTFS